MKTEPKAKSPPRTVTRVPPAKGPVSGAASETVGAGAVVAYRTCSEKSELPRRLTAHTETA